jgi:death-on-curing family protein
VHLTLHSPGEHIGVKVPELLESAVHRPQSSAFGEDAYPTIFEIAAALFESLGQNHPFHNANKWTAFTALVVLLRFNGLHFKMDARKPKILQWIWLTINSIVNKRLRSLKLTAPRFPNHKSKPLLKCPFFHLTMSVFS